MTPEELAYHLRECQAPPGFCPVCDTAKATRNVTLEEAARICTVGKEAVRGNPEKDMAYWAFDWCETEIHALKKDDRDE